KYIVSQHDRDGELVIPIFEFYMPLGKGPSVFSSLSIIYQTGEQIELWHYGIFAIYPQGVPQYTAVLKSRDVAVCTPYAQTDRDFRALCMRRSYSREIKYQ